MTNPWNSDVPPSFDSSWLACAECLKRVQRKTSDDERVHWLPRCLSTHCRPALEDAHATRPRTEYRCLILGASEGWMERLWRERGFLGGIVASDIADKALARAERAARAAGYADISYVVADLNHHRFEGPFDYIVAEGVLHHVENIESCLRMLDRALAPGGLVFATEFVGPVRFQMSARQAAWINAALAVLPRGLRPLGPGGDPSAPASADENARIRFVPPSERAIREFDPSEAICGPELERLLPIVFEVVERRGFGGPILSYLTGHFDFSRTTSDPAARDWLHLIMDLEDMLVRTGILRDEFVHFVLRKRARPS